MTRQLWHLAQSVADVVDAELAEHERIMHAPARPPLRRPVLAAVPFAHARLSDAQLAAIVEHMELEGLDEAEAAAIAGVPTSLLRRELADYASRYRRFLWERATTG